MAQMTEREELLHGILRAAVSLSLQRLQAGDPVAFAELILSAHDRSYVFKLTDPSELPRCLVIDVNADGTLVIHDIVRAFIVSEVAP